MAVAQVSEVPDVRTITLSEVAQYPVVLTKLQDCLLMLSPPSTVGPTSPLYKRIPLIVRRALLSMKATEGRGVLTTDGGFLVTSDETSKELFYVPNSPKESVVVIRAKVYGKGEDDVCAICLENIHSLAVKTLSCGHIFHDTCAKKLEKRKLSCPVCRA
jgi:hypothetical protein